MDISTAVVLAAGEGRRLRPLTRYRPKPMLPAANRPILEYVLDALVNAGVADLHVVVGYHRDRVQDHFGSRYRGVPIAYHVQEKQLGSGHALLQARDAIESDFLVVNGDEVVATEMVEAVMAGHTIEEIASLAVIESEAAPQYGAVELDEGMVVALEEKPDDRTHRLMNAGIYAFGPSVFEEADRTPRESGELALTDTISRLVDHGERVRGVRTGGLRTEATYPWDLPELASDLLDAGIIDEPEHDPGVYLADSASIHPTAVLNAPVVIGADTVVEAHAVVGPDVALGRNTTVESGAVVEGSVLDDDSRIGPNATFADSVTGQAVAIGAGVTVPRGPGDVRVGNRIYEDERLGCVAADRARIGGGATIEPGSLIGPDATLGLGVYVSGNVDADEEVRR